MAINWISAASIFGAVWLVTCTRHSSSSGCSLRELNFTATVEDQNGLRCRQKITTAACFGGCDRMIEYDPFPYSSGDSESICTIDRVQQRMVILDNCEDGVDEVARRFVFAEAVSCSCTPCNPANPDCASTTAAAAVAGPRRKRLGGRIGAKPLMSLMRLGAARDSDEKESDVHKPSYDWRKPMRVSTRIRLLTREAPEDA